MTILASFLELRQERSFRDCEFEWNRTDHDGFRLIAQIDSATHFWLR